MTVGELFVRIGLKGGETVAKGLKSVQGDLKAITQNSITSKLAIGSLFIALEEMARHAINYGADLKTAQSAFGIDPSIIQSWQNVGAASNASAEEIEGSILSLSKSMANLRMRGMPPEFFKVVQQLVEFDPAKAEDMGYALNQLQLYTREALKLGRSKMEISSVLESFGLGTGIIKTMMENKADMAKLQGTILGQGQVDRLADTAKAFRQIGRDMMFVGADLAEVFAFPLADTLKHAASGLVSMFRELRKILPPIKGYFDAFTPVLAAIIAFINPIAGAVMAVTWLLSEWDKHHKGNKDNVFDYLGSDKGKKSVKSFLGLDKYSNPFNMSGFQEFMMGSANYQAATAGGIGTQNNYFNIQGDDARANAREVDKKLTSSQNANVKKTYQKTPGTTLVK